MFQFSLRKMILNFKYFRTLRKMPDPPQTGTGKRVLIMIPSLARGGAQRVVLRLTDSLAEKCSIYVLIEQEKENIYQLSSRTETLFLPHFYHDISRLLSAHYVRILKKKYHIDVSLSLLFSMNWRNVFSKGKEKVIVSERNNPKIAHQKTYRMTHLVNALADHVVFQTKEVQSFYCRSTQAHSSILPNPVSVSCLASAERKPRIVNPARLHENKNQTMLIRAFALFLPAHPEYTLTIYGEGELQEELKALISNLNLEGKAFIHENVADIHEQIADAGMFVLSSNAEGMPNALLEAMMMGLPCISTACTGAKEVIQNGVNGLLTEVGNTEELAAAMAWMADHPEQAEIMRHNAMKTAEAFRTEKVIGQWEKLILEP